MNILLFMSMYHPSISLLLDYNITFLMCRFVEENNEVFFRISLDFSLAAVLKLANKTKLDEYILRGTDCNATSSWTVHCARLDTDV